MFFTDLFTKKCLHTNVLPDVDSAYCPDCGKLIKNQWYITRCACCGVKLRAMSKNGKIVPQAHYCTNCGACEFEVEKLDKINFIDINFAVLIKQVIDENTVCKSTTRLWQEKTDVQPRLLIKYS